MSEKQLKRFETWKKPLDKYDIQYEKSDFINNYEKIDFSVCSTMVISYYTSKYFMIMSLNQMEHILRETKKEIMKNRGSMYDSLNVSKKMNISIEDAVKIVKERKLKTSGNINNFIKRHGEEEGRKKFEIFKNKSKSTKENFKKRYGKNWEERWNYYISSRSTRTLDSYIKKYGVEKGTTLYNKVINEIKNYTTLDGLIKTHGEKIGTEKFYQLSRKKSFYGTLSGFIEKYGKEKGENKYKQANIKKGKAATLDGYIEKFGKHEGQKQYDKKRMECSPIFQELKKIFGENMAIIKYKSHSTKDIQKNILGYTVKTPPFYRSKKGCVSKIATNFFVILEKEMGGNFKYGKKKDELSLFDQNLNKKYFYDCYHEESNTIVEMHGIAFHPKKGQTDWTNPFGGTYEEFIKKDENKKLLAVQNKFNYLVVWDDEINTKTKIKNRIEQIKKQLNENKKNTK